MRLTIIVDSKSVGKDGKFYDGLNLTTCGIPSDVWALQWQSTSGHIEFIDDRPNQNIRALPAWATRCVAVWDVSFNAEANPPPPTAEDNKQTAMDRLRVTDWTTLPDVADSTKSNPYLSNAAEFVTYRNLIRQHAVTPTAGVINWPTVPRELWVRVTR
jgi:hypothetical protein